jgi:hypothetical protein
LVAYRLAVVIAFTGAIFPIVFFVLAVMIFIALWLTILLAFVRAGSVLAIVLVFLAIAMLLACWFANPFFTLIGTRAVLTG